MRDLELEFLTLLQVLPVLKILHEGVASLSSNSHHMYLALIVMLILSEDDFFCKIIHETVRLHFVRVPLCYRSYAQCYRR